MTTITDGFTRAGADALGTSSEGWSWTELTGDLDISSSGVTAESTGYSGQNFARAEADLASPNHYAQLRVTQWAANSSAAIHVHARFAAASNSSLVFYIRNDAGGSSFTYRVFKQTAVSFTQIGSTISAPSAPVAPYTARIEVNASNIIKGFIDGVEKISVGPDSFNSSELRTGIGAVPISPTATLLDDFQAGDLSVPTSFPPVPMLMMPHLVM